MFDRDDDYSYERTCNMLLNSRPKAASTTSEIISLPVRRTSTQPASTDVIFDTGATGSIVANGTILTNIMSCHPTEYKGLSGSLTVSKVGRVRPCPL